jgi:Arc/MetJ-type ribon-helix-helix transcriptional regulator
MKYKKDKTFTMRMPLNIHRFLEQYSKEKYTSMSNIITQLILDLQEKNKKNNEDI